MSVTTEELLKDILDELKSSNKNSRLWDIQDIADYFKLSKNSASNRLLCKPAFPKAIKIEGVGKRWKPSEVKAYAERNRIQRVA
jgi:phage pi2 protein 07